MLIEPAAWHMHVYFANNSIAFFWFGINSMGFSTTKLNEDEYMKTQDAFRRLCHFLGFRNTGKMSLHHSMQHAGWHLHKQHVLSHGGEGSNLTSIFCFLSETKTKQTSVGRNEILESVSFQEVAVSGCAKVGLSCLSWRMRAVFVNIQVSHETLVNCIDVQVAAPWRFLIESAVNNADNLISDFQFHWPLMPPRKGPVFCDFDTSISPNRTGEFFFSELRIKCALLLSKTGEASSVLFKLSHHWCKGLKRIALPESSVFVGVTVWRVYWIGRGTMKTTTTTRTWLQKASHFCSAASKWFSIFTDIFCSSQNEAQRSYISYKPSSYGSSSRSQHKTS